MEKNNRNKKRELFRSYRAYNILRQVEMLERPITKDISKQVDVSRSTVSTYIKSMREAGILKSEKSGRSRIIRFNHAGMLDYFIDTLENKIERGDIDSSEEEKLRNEILVMRHYEDESQKLLSIHMRSYLASFSNSTIEEMFTIGFLLARNIMEFKEEYISQEVYDAFTTALRIASGRKRDYFKQKKANEEEGLPETENDEESEETESYD